MFDGDVTESTTGILRLNERKAEGTKNLTDIIDVNDFCWSSVRIIGILLYF